MTGPYGVFTLRENSDRAAAVHRRRRRNGADPVAAALDGRAGAASGPPSTTTARADRGDLFHLEELAELARAAAELPVRARAVRMRRGRRLGRRARPDHRRGRPHRSRTSARWTHTCAARRRWSTPPSRCSSASGVPESRIYLRQVHDHRGLTAERESTRWQQTPSSPVKERSVPKPVFTDAEAGAQGVPVLDQPQLQLLHAGQAPGDRLRGRHRRRPARSRRATCSRAGSTRSPTAPPATRRSGRR